MKLEQHPQEERKNDFFKLVFEEWQEDFSLIEALYEPQIWLGLIDGQVVAGLALFYGRIPEPESWHVHLEPFQARAMPYLGYLVVRHTQRGEGLGTQFLHEVLRQLPQGAYIVTENPELQAFYERVGFKAHAQEAGEVLMSYSPL